MTARSRGKPELSPYLAEVDDAMKRAARRAREIARETGTPLVFLKEGNIVKLYLNPKGKKARRAKRPAA